jgi:hypothetical protein
MPKGNSSPMAMILQGIPNSISFGVPHIVLGTTRRASLGDILVCF